MSLPLNGPLTHTGSFPSRNNTGLSSRCSRKKGNGSCTLLKVDLSTTSSISFQEETLEIVRPARRPALVIQRQSRVLLLNNCYRRTYVLSPVCIFQKNGSHDLWGDSPVSAFRFLWSQPTYCLRRVFRCVYIHKGPLRHYIIQHVLACDLASVDTSC